MLSAITRRPDSRFVGPAHFTALHRANAALHRANAAETAHAGRMLRICIAQTLDRSRTPLAVVGLAVATRTVQRESA
jgi:hypothetical protein